MLTGTLEYYVICPYLSKMECMPKTILVCVCVMLVTGCGGGSGGSRSMIDGTWHGDLFQGVISCADGTFIAACGGCVVDTVELIVTGEDDVGSPVQAKDGDCIFEGQRTKDGFTANAVSGCDTALTGLEFNLLEENVAGLSYQYDIDKVEVQPGEIPCTISPSGTVAR